MAETIKERLEKIREKINAACKRLGRNPATVRILGASKKQPISAMLEAYEVGLRLFGENTVQELLEKKEKLPKDIEWHFIGTLQRRKVSKIIPFISCIQSLDSKELAEEINKRAVAADRVIDCLIETNIDKEESKTGVLVEELEPFLDSILPLKNLNIKGLMAIPSPKVSRKDAFKRVNLLTEVLKKGLKISDIELSMGMSDDFIEAVEEGSTIVRIGEALFGKRESSK